MAARKKTKSKKSTKKNSTSKIETKNIPKLKPMHKGGHYAFFTGIILVIISAIINYYMNFMTFETSIIVLSLIGFIVGFLNITRTETQKFLLSSLVIIVSFWLTMPAMEKVHVVLYNAWINIVVFVAMAAIVVAFKTVYETASDF